MTVQEEGEPGSRGSANRVGFRKLRSYERSNPILTSGKMSLFLGTISGFALKLAIFGLELVIYAVTPV